MSIGANNNMGFKHIPLLLIAEVICEKCIVAGISIGDVGQRAPGCFCGKPRGQRWQRWCSPPFKNAPDDNTPMPDNLGYNPRRMYFHSFDNEEENPVDQFLDYLLTSSSLPIAPSLSDLQHLREREVADALAALRAAGRAPAARAVSPRLRGRPGRTPPPGMHAPPRAVPNNG
uniref:GRF-type domain-containing protein n=1 Tax=Meloidogyne hapla TaxID=6305 RepID=A0A1I8BU70_MELHA